MTASEPHPTRRAAANREPGGPRRPRRRLGIIALATAIVVGGVAVITLSSGQGDMAVPSAITPEGGLVVSTQQGAGVANAQAVAGPTPLRIELYTDYTHPDSARFASANALVLEQLVHDGAADLALFPVALSDDQASAASAVRVGNAVACVGEYSPRSLWAFHVALLAMQPRDEDLGLGDTDLIGVARDTGVQQMDDVRSCITSGSFAPWVESVSTSADVEDDVTFDRMPVVLVDGVPYTGDVDSSTSFRAFLSERIGDRFDT